jgi:small subunit ribosomal protein S21
VLAPPGTHDEQLHEADWRLENSGGVAGNAPGATSAPPECDSLTYSPVRFNPDKEANTAGEGVDERVAEVKVQEGESIESALRRFKRKVQQEDIIKDIKKHSFYLKPGDKRRAKQALARKRSRKKQRREME